jgi:hypothetical protein
MICWRCLQRPQHPLKSPSSRKPRLRNLRPRSDPHRNHSLRCAFLWDIMCYHDCRYRILIITSTDIRCPDGVYCSDESSLTAKGYKKQQQCSGFIGIINLASKLNMRVALQPRHVLILTSFFSRQCFQTSC